MEIALPVNSSRTIMIATLAVFVIGLVLSFSTWRNLRHQQDLFQEHALVTARSIVTGIEINLSRELAIAAASDPASITSLLNRTLAHDLLQDYIKRTDARFIGLFNTSGHILLSSHSDPKSIQTQLPTIAWESMGQDGEWSGEMLFHGQPIMVFGRISRMALGTICNDGDCLPGSEPPLLLVGMDMTQHLSAFNKYKNTALLQTGYTLAVTVVFWLLLLGFLQRADQGKRLQRLETFNARLLDTMPDGLLNISHDGVIVAANPAATALLGGPDTALVGHHLSSIFSSIGAPQPTPEIQEWCTLRSHGKHLEILQLPLKDGSDQHMVLIRDRTELAGLEQELHRNEKLAAIGRMAAGVAHEIRNPLSALRGFAQFFSKKLAGRDPEELYAKTMVQEADRLNRVITDLLFLARPHTLQALPVELPDIIRETRTLMAMDLEAAHCTLETDLAATSVNADRDTLKQALINLIMNSMGALPEDGGWIRITSETADGGTWVRVADNGQGMTDQEREHALEPFFTTKARGTGLGLAIVHAIMQEHAGEIGIDSTPGHGTTVSLFFPATDSETQA